MVPHSELFHGRIQEMRVPLSQLSAQIRQVREKGAHLTLADRASSSIGVQDFLLRQLKQMRQTSPESTFGVLIINKGDQLAYPGDQPYGFGVYMLGMDIEEDGRLYKGVGVRDFSERGRQEYKVYHTTPQGWRPQNGPDIDPHATIHERILRALSSASSFRDNTPINVTPTGKRLPYVFY